MSRNSSAPARRRRSGHIPFTPRAKKTLELALREALQLKHEYIGTEHILLGLIREGERGEDEGVAVKILRRARRAPGDPGRGAEPGAPGAAEKAFEPALARAPARRPGRVRSRLEAERPEQPGAEQAALNATPAADATLSEAARLAGTQPVGSHHLLLASLADPGTAAARALAALGVNLDQAQGGAARAWTSPGPATSCPRRRAAGRWPSTSPETGSRLEAADPVLVKAGHEALAALGDEAKEPGTIRGDLPVSASLGRAWQALFESLRTSSGARPHPPGPPIVRRGQPAPGGPPRPGRAGFLSRRLGRAPGRHSATRCSVSAGCPSQAVSRPASRPSGTQPDARPGARRGAGPRSGAVSACQRRLTTRASSAWAMSDCRCSAALRGRSAW